MEQLEDLMDKLDADKFCAVTIYKKGETEPIYRNFTHQNIKDEFGDSASFFEKINADGHTKLKIQVKRKNGNAFKIDGDSFNVSFGDSDEKPKKSSMGKVAKKKKKKKDTSGLLGLGMADIFDLKLKANDADKYEKRIIELEKKNELLEKNNAELKEAELQRKYTKESNDSLNNMLLGGIKQVPVIMRSLGFHVPEATGLGMGVDIEDQDNNYSQTKKDFLALVKEMDDDTALTMMVLYNKINESSADNTFPLELFELMKKHKLIQE